MEIIQDSANLLLTVLVIGFAGAIALLAYITLRPQTGVSAAQDSSQEPRPLVESNERIHSGAGRTPQPHKQGADRAA